LRTASAFFGGVGAIDQLLDELVEIADHDEQEIVEIMSEAPGQLADGLHLLGLPELPLHGPALGDVLDDGEKIGGIPVTPANAESSRRDKGRAAVFRIAGKRMGIHNI
jgi:hypothetical protein